MFHSSFPSLYVLLNVNEGEKYKILYKDIYIYVRFHREVYHDFGKNDTVKD